MRVSALVAVLLLLPAFMSLNTDQAGALTPNAPTIERTASIFDKLFSLNFQKQDDEQEHTEQPAEKTDEKEADKSAEKPDEAPKKKPKPTRYKVKQGDTLIAIAKKHKTSWQRIYAKNKKIEHPDNITVGETLVIPSRDEKLKKRKNPAVTNTSQANASSTAAAPQSQRSPVSTQAISRTGNSSGNTYYYGYCTWYAKSKRPDLPNNLGNANTWVARAAAQGFATGSTPHAGAIGQQGMHVVYVEKVNSNGTVTVSEMNYEGFGVVSRRTVPASTFHYIY